MYLPGGLGKVRQGKGRTQNISGTVATRAPGRDATTNGTPTDTSTGGTTALERSARQTPYGLALFFGPLERQHSMIRRPVLIFFIFQYIDVDAKCKMRDEMLLTRLR